METWQIGVAIVSVDIVSIRRMLKPSVSHNLTSGQIRTFKIFAEYESPEISSHIAGRRTGSRHG